MPDDGSILVAGGDQDPNLLTLVDALRRNGHPVRFLCIGTDHDPWLHWDLATDTLHVDGELIAPHAAFVRYDVFTHQRDGKPQSSQRAQAWYTTVAAWLAAHPEVRVLNRHARLHEHYKPTVLCWARDAGLAVPTTAVSNHFDSIDAFLPGTGKIAKPVAGGGYCHRLDDARDALALRRPGVAPAPAIVQPELIQPEYRLFRIGDRYLGFAVVTDALDYRVEQDCRLEPWQPPTDLVEGLGRLTDRMQLDFGAADFKTCADTGELLLLEVNTGPMFAAFDRASSGTVTEAIGAFLAT